MNTILFANDKTSKEFVSLPGLSNNSSRMHGCVTFLFFYVSRAFSLNAFAFFLVAAHAIFQKRFTNVRNSL